MSDGSALLNYPSKPMYLEMQFHDIKTNVPKWDAAGVTLLSTPVLSFLKKIKWPVCTQQVNSTVM